MEIVIDVPLFAFDSRKALFGGSRREAARIDFRNKKTNKR